MVHVFGPRLGRRLAIQAGANEVDAGAVERDGKLVCQKRGVVAAVVPARGALVQALIPHALGELDGGDRLGRVDGYRLAVLLDLFAAMRPEEWIEERRRITKGLGERLARRLADRRELGHGGAELVPCSGHRHAGLREVVLAVDKRVAHDVVRDSAVLPVDHRAGIDLGVVFAEFRLDLLGHVRQVIQAFSKCMRRQILHLEDGRARLTLNRRRKARREVVGIDGFNGNVDPGLLRPIVSLLFEERIGCGNEVIPLQQRHRRAR